MLSKHDPLVDIVELIQATPQYTHVRFQNRRETTVSTKHLAPPGASVQIDKSESQPANQNSFKHGLDDVTMEIQNTVEETSNLLSEAELPPVNKIPAYSNIPIQSTVENEVPIHRSTHLRKAPERLDA